MGRLSADSNCMDCGELVTTGGHVCPEPRAQQPFTCPVCCGATKVSRPPWVAGDTHYYTDSVMKLHECQACKGTGVVWGPR